MVRLRVGAIRIRWDLKDFRLASSDVVVFRSEISEIFPGTYRRYIGIRFVNK